MRKYNDVKLIVYGIKYCRGLTRLSKIFPYKLNFAEEKKRIEIVPRELTLNTISITIVKYDAVKCVIFITCIICKKHESERRFYFLSTF